MVGQGVGGTCHLEALTLSYNPKANNHGHKHGHNMGYKTVLSSWLFSSKTASSYA